MPLRAQQADLVFKATSGKGVERRELLLQKIAAAQRAQQVYSLAFNRWAALTSSAHSVELPVRGRLASGLGQDSVLEIGVTLHHTYGTPLIRGSALKGLAAHSVIAFGGLMTQGSSWTVTSTRCYSEPPIQVDSSRFMMPGSRRPACRRKVPGVVLDVMTVHHGPYYMGEDETAPTDFDDPNPISFLSVAGTFRFRTRMFRRERSGAPLGQSRTR